MRLDRALVFRRKPMLLVSFFVLLYSYPAAWLAAQQMNSTAPADGLKMKKEMEALSGFEGRWACQGVFPSSGKRIESQVVFTRDLEGAWLSVRHDDLPPNRFHAFEFWGFDPEAKQLVAFIYDNFGGARKFTSPGWTEDKLVWSGEATKTDPPTIQRFVFKRDSPAQFVMNYEVKKGSGAWVVGDTITCKK